MSRSPRTPLSTGQTSRMTGHSGSIGGKPGTPSSALSRFARRFYLRERLYTMRIKSSLKSITLRNLLPYRIPCGRVHICFHISLWPSRTFVVACFPMELLVMGLILESGKRTWVLPVPENLIYSLRLFASLPESPIGNAPAPFLKSCQYS